MKFRYLVIILILAVSCKNETAKLSCDLPQLKMTKLFETKGLPNCESVVLDKKSNTLFVSVQNGNVIGDGTIAKVSIDGEIIDANFVTGLNDPKGIVISNNKLYVSDVTQLVEIDLDNLSKIKKYKGERSQFLNDTTIDKEGNVYVSDMFTSAIYKLDTKGNFKEWLQSPKIENPNGLFVDNNILYCASWGYFNDKNPAKAPKGHFSKIDLETKQITRLSENAIGNMDGLQPYDESVFIISDWLNGKLFLACKNGENKWVKDVPQSTGDIAFVKESKRLILPIANTGTLAFYTIDEL